MTRFFADTAYWVARIHPRDQWHKVFRGLGRQRIVSTDEVLTEVLAHFSGLGPLMRTRAVRIIRATMVHPDIEIVPQTRQSFLDGLALYAARSDKGYSLTDCISMVTMRREGLSEVLTRDAHFTQEGFTLVP